MFDFTTLTVFNTIVPATDAEVKSGAVKNANLITSTNSKVLPAIRIGNTRFNPSLIEKIYMKSATPESLASVTFDMNKLTLDEYETQGLARIILYIGLSMNSQDSVYANPWVYKGKPFYVEFKIFSTTGAAGSALEGQIIVDADKTAKECARVIKKFLLFETDEKLLDVTVGTGTNGTAVGSVKISGVNGYLQIRKAVLQLFDPDAISVDCCTKQGEFVDVITGVPAVYEINTDAPVNAGDPAIGQAVVVEDNSKVQKLLEDGSKGDIEDNEVPILPGIEAFGDYNWLIHNLRLPTAGNTSYFGPNKAEMPVVGQTYTQFTITMKDTRRKVAGEGVGMEITSVTTHVLYVATPYAATVKAAFNALNNVTVDETTDTELEQPYA